MPKRSNANPRAYPVFLLSRHLDALRDPVRLPAVDLLARLGNRLEHLLVGQRLFGHDLGRLRVERDLVRLDACGGCELATVPGVILMW